ncbi:fungal-specific transcription factor domain-containing protein [Chlamydoabsidia padenii]|nr:fungal-specific transcription factor domain-containing protein [Chlamydoabsidia padenii]
MEMPSEKVVLHLVDYFFKYINSIFPLVHHSTLIQSIKDGSISQPLLWSVMAIGARFSDHPEIKTDPPYWAGEKFARKAGSMISTDLFEPTVPNLQFWGVMACLEYGRAAGSRAWIYGGLAARICFELGFHKEETLKIPIYQKDGTMDRVAMLMRRRIFWSCINIDKHGSAGNSRPQFFTKGDYDVGLPDEESLALLNPLHQNVTVDYKPIKVDSLGSFVKHYLLLMELFGLVIKGLQRAKGNQGKAIWPPMDDFDELNNELQAWKRNLPEHYDFSLNDLDYHLERASRGRINHYLCAHVIWHTLMLALHRGSLAFVDQKDNTTNHLTAAFSQQTWERIQYSVSICKQVVNDVMPIFKAMKDICGINVIPYMGYSSYMFATILMTSTFTKTEEQHRKGTKGLLLLYDMIELLRPYWPVCERLSITTRDLIVQHSRMYEYSQEEHYKRTGYELPLSPPRQHQLQSFPAYSSRTTSSTTSSPTSSLTTSSSTIPVSMTGLLHSSEGTAARTPTTNYTYSLSSLPLAAPTPSSSLLSTTMDIGKTSYDPIDFNSSAFLYDTGLFGQIMFDETKFMTNSNNAFEVQQPMVYTNNNLSTPSTTAPAFMPQESSPEQPMMIKRPWDPVWRP